MTYAPPESSGQIEEFSRDELRKEITHDYSTSLEESSPSLSVVRSDTSFFCGSRWRLDSRSCSRG